MSCELSIVDWTLRVLELKYPIQVEPTSQLGWAVAQLGQGLGPGARMTFLARDFTRDAIDVGFTRYSNSHPENCFGELASCKIHGMDLAITAHSNSDQI